MSKTDPLVIPESGAFGFRVNRATPLAKVVAVLRQANPRVPFAQLKTTAEQLMRGEVSGERAPVPFDSGAAGVGEQPLQAESTAPAEVAPLDESRAAVAAWVATQKKLSMSKSGRIPAAIMTAYREAHREEHLASLVPVVDSSGHKEEPIPADAPPTETVI